jgi:hypothetical protein
MPTVYSRPYCDGSTHRFDHEAFECLALNMIDVAKSTKVRHKKRKETAEQFKQCRIRSHFALDSYEMAFTWELLHRKRCMNHLKKNERNPKHFLFSLYFVKNYTVGPVSADKFGVTEKTYRKYVWMYIMCLGMLAPKIVSRRVFCSGRGGGREGGGLLLA